MLTKPESVVYNFLCQNCNFAQFNVVEISSVLKCLQEVAISAKRSDAKQILNALQQTGHITVKYADENVYCIKLLKQQPQMPSQQKIEQQKPLNFVFFLKIFATTFLACLFAGTMLLLLAKLAKL